MELNYFKDKLFDVINEGMPGVLDIRSDDKDHLFWVIIDDGSVFRLQCGKAPFHLFKPPHT